MYACTKSDINYDAIPKLTLTKRGKVGWVGGGGKGETGAGKGKLAFHPVTNSIVFFSVVVG